MDIESDVQPDNSPGITLPAWREAATGGNLARSICERLEAIHSVLAQILVAVSPTK